MTTTATPAGRTPAERESDAWGYRYCVHCRQPLVDRNGSWTHEDTGEAKCRPVVDIAAKLQLQQFAVALAEASSLLYRIDGVDLDAIKDELKSITADLSACIDQVGNIWRDNLR